MTDTDYIDAYAYAYKYVRRTPRRNFCSFTCFEVPTA